MRNRLSVAAPVHEIDENGRMFRRNFLFGMRVEFGPVLAQHVTEQQLCVQSRGRTGVAQFVGHLFQEIADRRLAGFGTCVHRRLMLA